MTHAGRQRDRALELRRTIRNASVMLAAAGTMVFGGIAATTLPGKVTGSSAQLQGPTQLPGSVPGGSSIVTGGSAVQGSTGTGTAGGGLQAPAQAPGSGQGGSPSVITGAS